MASDGMRKETCCVAFLEGVRASFLVCGVGILGAGRAWFETSGGEHRMRIKIDGSLVSAWKVQVYLLLWSRLLTWFPLLHRA